MPLARLHLQPLATPVSNYTFRAGDNTYDLDAPYQRGSVWTLEQRRALIKSILMGLPIGSVIVSEQPFAPGRAHFRVIDGKQRIETIWAFTSDEFTVPAEWFRADDVATTVDVDGEAHVAFSGLTERGQRTFENSPFPTLRADLLIERSENPDGSWTNRRRSDDEVLIAEAEVFLLINAAGTDQTPDDLARAAGIAGA